MNVGPAPSGSGSLAFRNTVSPLVKYGVEGSPYEGKYLVTKGQALGDLILTYTAAGTMVKGSGIRIKTDLPIDQGFYPYNAGGPGGGVVLERGSAMFAVDPVHSDADGISKNTLYVKTTASLEAGSQIGFRVRNLNLKVHGIEDGIEVGQNTTMIVTDYTLEGSSSSPLAADGAASLANVGDAPVITVTGAHMSGEMKLSARGVAGDLTHATAGEPLGSLIFTYNTTQPMATGAMVQIELPQGWSTPFHATSMKTMSGGRNYARWLRYPHNQRDGIDSHHDRRIEERLWRRPCIHLQGSHSARDARSECVHHQDDGGSARHARRAGTHNG